MPATMASRMSCRMPLLWPSLRTASASMRSSSATVSTAPPKHSEPAEAVTDSCSASYSGWRPSGAPYG